MRTCVGYILFIISLTIGAALGQNQYSPDYVLLHATSPDPYSNLALGNPPKPGLVPLTSPLGATILYFDSAAGCLKASTNGGPYGCLGTGSASFNPIQKASAQAGATADVQITNAIAALTGGNGIVWADYAGGPTWAACPTFGSGNVHLVLYSATFSVSANCTIPSNVTLEFKQGALLAPANGKTITIQGNILAPVVQLFSNIASGQGAMSFSNNKKLTTYSPVWFGIDCSGVGDNAPIWNQILSFTGDNTHFVLPIGCTDMHASTVTVSSRSGFKLTSETRMQNGGGNVQPVNEKWTGSTGGMWDFQANQGAIIDGIFFSNTSSAHVDYFLRFDGNPSTYIGTEELVTHNTFTNNMINPTIGGAGTFDAITINTVSGQNHEKNVITDNDFFCSQSKAFRESDSTQINNGSATVTCGAANCTYTTDANVGDRLRVSYATGIFDTTVLSITDNNHLQANVNFTGTSQTNARLHFRQAYGNGITIGSVNAKHNTIDRNSFTQCARGINMTNGSFSLEHVGGSANDVLVYIQNSAEPTQLNYVEDESTLRDLYIGNSDAPIILSHPRNSLGIAGEFDGFIYVATSARLTITGAVLQDTPGANSVVIGAPNVGSTQLTSIGNQWGPGVVTMALLGFSQWRTALEGSGVSAGWLVSCGDFDITDAPTNGCFQFGEGGAVSAEGHVIVGSGHPNNTSSFNMFTAEPNSQSTGFASEARGFRTNFNGFNNSTLMTWLGFDAQFLAAVRGGNFAGFRAGLPTVNTTTMPFARGLWVQAPTAGTQITTASGVYVEDLNSHTGITNRYSFFGVGGADTAHFGGPVESFGANTITVPASTVGLTVSGNSSTETAISVPFGKGTILFNTLTSTSTNPSLTGSLRLGPTDPLKYRCVSGCPGGTSPIDYILAQGNGASPAQLGDLAGVKIGAGSTVQVGSGTASNTDLTGVLAFSAATTSASYTFTGTYTSAPDCIFSPLFDYGVHRLWISTMTTATLQLSSDAAQTGNVTYVCIFRN